METTIFFLPSEVLLTIFECLSPREVCNIALVCKLFCNLSGSDRLWRHLYLLAHGRESIARNASWMKMFQELVSGRWDDSNLEGNLETKTFIVLEERNKICNRPSTLGSNPAVMATLPLSEWRNSYLVRVEEMGLWVSVGVATKKLRMSGDGVVGAQYRHVGGFNLGYYCHGQIGDVRYNGSMEITGLPAIEKKDVVLIHLDRLFGRVIFFKNGEKVADHVITAEEQTLDIYPTVSISQGTTVFLQSFRSL